MQLRNDDPLVIEQRITNDRTLFNESKLDRVDLIILNESKTLDELANYVNDKYQVYINRAT